MNDLDLSLEVVSRARPPLRYILADRTNGRCWYSVALRLSVVCDVMYCG